MGQAADRPQVLVIEDEDGIALALDIVLGREGYRRDRLASGAGAVDAIRSQHPDLVILDVMLPEVSGYDICRQVRQDPALSDVKILMMTARGTGVEQSRGLALGADGFLAKPFALSDLRSELGRLIGPQAAAARAGGRREGEGKAGR